MQELRPQMPVKEQSRNSAAALGGAGGCSSRQGRSKGKDQDVCWTSAKTQHYSQEIVLFAQLLSGFTSSQILEVRYQDLQKQQIQEVGVGADHEVYQERSRG